jgi:hypothetical protein
MVADQDRRSPSSAIRMTSDFAKFGGIGAQVHRINPAAQTSQPTSPMLPPQKASI